MCNDNEYFDGSGIVQEFQKSFSIKENPHKLHSLSIYAFNIEKRLLRVQDMDTVFLKKGQLIPAKRYPIKNVQRGSAVKGEVYMSPGRKEPIQLITEKARNKNIILKTTCEAGLDRINIDVKESINLETEYTLATKILYDIELLGPGSQLFYSGAIQPSDFSMPMGFDVHELDKIIKVYLYSGKMSPFYAWFFNGTERLSFPLIEKSLLNEESGIHRIIKNIEFKNINLSLPRAYYFSTFAYPC